MRTEHSRYENKENNWTLDEYRSYELENESDVQVDVLLLVTDDMSEKVEDERLDDDVWQFDWTKVEGPTNYENMTISQVVVSEATRTNLINTIFPDKKKEFKEFPIKLKKIKTLNNLQDSNDNGIISGITELIIKQEELEMKEIVPGLKFINTIANLSKENMEEKIKEDKELTSRILLYYKDNDEKKVFSDIEIVSEINVDFFTNEGKINIDMLLDYIKKYTLNFAISEFRNINYNFIKVPLIDVTIMNNYESLDTKFIISVIPSFVHSIIKSFPQEVLSKYEKNMNINIQEAIDTLHLKNKDYFINNYENKKEMWEKKHETSK